MDRDLPRLTLRGAASGHRGKSSGRWHRLQELFHRTAGLGPDERTRLLARECPDDDELRREVEALLASDADDRPLSASIGEVAGELTAGALAPGERVGPYRVVSELGRGGMGAVYLAERAGTDFEQQVALKVLAGIVASPAAVERFRAERRILAQLEHPHITRLLDGGTTPEGAPWFAMERVEGEPIDAWCDRRRLPIEGRLRLFLGICDAVQYAHRQLVVHRDLKPSNVLIGADGAPKLLDFGIAKLLDPSAEEAASTRLGELPMTPEYASPEQVRGRPVTTASDVYSLGLLLYELLSGRRAHRLTSLERRDVERAVCEEPATRPSQAVSRPAVANQEERGRTRSPEEIADARRTTPRALARSLAGDLDTIVLAALRKEPDQRYGSVEALAGDVRRHLEGLPVEARGDRLGYRAGKFVRRHRAVAVAAAIAATGLVAAALTSTWGLVRARAAEADARREAATAQETATFLRRLFAVSDPNESRGADLTAREILDRGATRVEEELSDQPVVRARLLDTMARSYAGLGLIDEARGLFQRAYELRRELFGERHPETLESLGGLGTALFQLGHLERAESYLRRAWETGREVRGEEDVETLKYLGNLAITVDRLGRREEAIELHRRCYELRRRALGEDHAHTLMAAVGLGNALSNAGRTDEAIELFERARSQMIRLYGPDHPQTLHAIHNLAIAYADVSRREEQEALLVEVVQRARRVLGDEHPDTLIFRSNLALLRAQTGRFDEAESIAREVLAARREVLGEDHPSTAKSLQNLGEILLVADRPAEAEEPLRAALEISRRMLGPENPQTLETRRLLAELYRRSGRDEEARRLDPASGTTASPGAD